jgi:hypothetical protein
LIDVEFGFPSTFSFTALPIVETSHASDYSHLYPASLLGRLADTRWPHMEGTKTLSYGVALAEGTQSERVESLATIAGWISRVDAASHNPS